MTLLPGVPHGRGGVRDRVGALGENAVQLGEGGVDLVEHGGEGGRAAGELPGAGGHVVKDGGEGGHGGAGDLLLQAGEAGGAALDGVVHAVGEAAHGVVCVLDVGGDLLQGVHLAGEVGLGGPDLGDGVVQGGQGVGLARGAVGKGAHLVVDAAEGGGEAPQGVVGDAAHLGDGAVELALGPADVAGDLADGVVCVRGDAGEGAGPAAEGAGELGGQARGLGAGVGEGAERVRQAAGDARGAAGEVLQGGAGLGHGGAGVGEGALGAVEAVGQAGQGAGDVAQVGDDGVARLVGLGGDVARRALELLGDGLARHLQELVGDLVVQGGGAGVCDLGGHGVGLLVDVVRDVGGADVAVDDVSQGGGEVGRHDEGGVVPAAAHALHGLILGVEEGPAQLGVLLQLLANHVAGVDLAHVTDLCALVVYDDGDGHGGGVLVGVPVGEDVEPRVQGRDDGNAKGDYDGHGVLEEPPEVPLEYLECLSHRPRSPSSMYVGRAPPALQLLWCGFDRISIYQGVGIPKRRCPVFLK